MSDSPQISFYIDQLFHKLTISQVLKREFRFSSRLLRNLKHSGGIVKNGLTARTVDEVFAGDRLEIRFPLDIPNETLVPENLPLDILYEDEFYIAVNKSSGIVVHPTSGHVSGTLANGLAYYFQKHGLSYIIRPINRLDRDTSGVVLFAKNAYAQEFVVSQMKEQICEKLYFAIVKNTMLPLQGTIDLSISRKAESIMLREVNPTGDRAVTHYNVIKHFSNASFVQIRLETGRTHQIRVHFSHLGYPLLGDTLYGDPFDTVIQRQALHSFLFGFIHPLTKKKIQIYAKLPLDMLQLLTNLSTV